MVLKRRRPQRRRSVKRRRTGRARVRGLRYTARRQLFATKRFHYKVDQVGDTVGQQSAGVTFQLSDLPANADFSTLFDQYKIAGVAYRWVVVRDPSVQGTNNGIFPRICWVHDFDSSSAPTGTAELQEYPRFMTAYMTESRQATRWYFIKPARLAVEYISAIASNYRPTWKGMVDMTNINQPHYGIRYVITDNYTGQRVRLETKYYIVCKNVR